MDDGPVTIRVATIADAPVLSRLRFEWRSGERGERGLDEQAFEEALTSWMSEHRATHVPFLADRRSTPIGMAWLAVVDRVPGPRHFTRRSAYIQSVYVLPGERDRGVGRHLMEAVLDHAGELGLDYVAVHPSARAFSLYRRLGFSETDRVLELRR